MSKFFVNLSRFPGYLFPIDIRVSIEDEKDNNKKKEDMHSTNKL